MDPLSIAASLVALIGAGNQIAKALNKLASVRGAPAFILSLNNELSDLRLVLEETETLLAEHQTRDDVHAEKHYHLITEKRLFPSLQNVWNRIQELQVVVGRLTTSSGAINRFLWLREQDNINKIQKNLRSARSDVVAILGLISSKSTFRIETQLQEVHSLTLQGNTYISQSLTQQTEALRQIIETQQKHVSLNEKVPETLVAEKQEKRSITKKDTESRKAGDPAGSEGDEFSALRMRFLRRRKCKPWCSCRCHSRTRFNTPELFHAVLGQLFVGYTGFPALASSCDIPEQCQGTSQALVQINYYFPPWFLARVLAFSMRRSDFQRPEYSLRVLNIRSTFEAIFVGAVGNDADLIRSLISNNYASVLDVTDDDGHSALHMAVKSSNVEATKVLLELGAEPHLENNTHETPYDMAWNTILCFQDTPNAKSWRVEEMRALFPSHNAIEERRKFTKLHKIINKILYCDLEKELTRSRDLINQSDADGRTALSYAAARGDSVAVDILLRYGADPNIPDRIGQGPLRQSMKAHDSTCTALLLNAGARANHRDNWQQTALICSVFHPEPLPFITTLLMAGADINAFDFQGSSVLMEAMKFNASDSVQLLLENHAHVNEVDHFGMSPFLHGVRFNSHSALRVLLDFDVHIIHNRKDSSGKSALHWAAEVGDIETLLILTHTRLDGLRIQDKTKAGLTAIDVAEKRHEFEENIKGKDLINNEWLDAFRGLLETIRVPTANASPKSATSFKSDLSDDVYYDALSQLSFEEVSELVEKGEARPQQ